MKRKIAATLLALSLAGCAGVGSYKSAEKACQSVDSHVRKGSIERDTTRNKKGKRVTKGYEARCQDGTEVETSSKTGKNGWKTD